MIDCCTSESRCSNASAAVSSSSDCTMRAASCDERSLMMSASSEGWSRERRAPETERCTSEGLTSEIGATLSHAMSARGTRSKTLGATLPAPSRRKSPATPDVGCDHAQRAARVRNLEIVDAHDFAAVDVDDLLVEEIAHEEERVLGAAARRRGASRAARRFFALTSMMSEIGAMRSPWRVLMMTASMIGNVSSGLRTRKSTMRPIVVPPIDGSTTAVRPTISERYPSLKLVEIGAVDPPIPPGFALTNPLQR